MQYKKHKLCYVQLQIHYSIALFTLIETMLFTIKCFFILNYKIGLFWILLFFDKNIIENQSVITSELLVK